MLTLLIIKFLRLSIRTRLIAGFSALAVILIVSAIIVFNFFIFESLSRLPNKDTLVYFHLNVDRHGNLQQIKILEQLLADFNLQDIDRHLVVDEIAFICGRETGDFSCRLAFLTSNIHELEKYLQSKRLPFQKSHKLFLIGQSGKLPAIQKSWNIFSIIKYQSAIPAKPLTLTLNIPNKLSSAEEKLLSFLPNNLKLSGTTASNKLILGDNTDFSFASLNITDLDFVLRSNTDNLKIKTNNSQNNHFDLVFDKSYGEMFLAGKKIGNAGELLDDYQLYFSANNTPSVNILNLWKTAFAQTAGTRLPSERSTYLNDNTRVRILTPNENPPFETDQQLTKIKISDKQTLYFDTKEGHFVAGNDQNFAPQPSNYPGQFAFLRISALPDNNLIKKYLSNFSFVILSDKSLIIE